jgi:signal transduction histidine kinase
MSLVKETSMPFQINAANAQVKLSIQCKPMINNDIESQSWLNDCILRVDKFKIQQVLRNLISNALKFTPVYGEVKIELEMLPIREFKFTVNSTENATISNFLRINVIDSGCGIAKTDQNKLFGQYVQFNANALQQGKGSGLGLWIAKSNLFAFHFYIYNFIPF